MNNLRLALGCSETSSTRLPAYLRLALNKQAIASLPKIWHVPASITEAKELILLCRELPLETIETLICAADNDTDDVSINDIAMNDADHDSHLPKTKLSLIETQRNSEQYIESIDNDIVAIRDQLHAILTTTFSATTLPNDANINSLQTILQTALDYPCSQLTRILAYNNELIAQLLEDQLSLLIDTLLLTISDLKTVLSHRALLFQHFLLPKVMVT
ncbi:hypothetical protein BDF19DRAFT_415321 [Syncephalis fuscata]|nr:hypothetical protein BDF19DRAFT_415321 [Syncephalis fuscata]